MEAVDINHHLNMMQHFAMHPPAILRPVYEEDKDFSNAVQLAEHKAMQAHDTIMAWEAKADEIIKEMTSLLKDPELVLTSDLTEALYSHIDTCEQLAAQTADDLRTARKKAKRQVKDWAKHLDPQLVKKFEKPYMTIIEMDYRIMQKYLEMAIFLRAMTGAHDPDNHVVDVIETDDQLEDFFSTLEGN